MTYESLDMYTVQKQLPHVFSSGRTSRQFWHEAKRISLTLQRPVVYARGAYTLRELCPSGDGKVLDKGWRRVKAEAHQATFMAGI